ncbi:MAG TPA: hypothetical protein VFW50_33645 [Streptosporangiaceae bacterium]|nr:hypothetical protein [Streptosporangiaceae bacterium]
MTGNEMDQHKSKADEKKDQPTWLKAWLKTHKGEDLYHSADAPAQWIKAIVQMAIGVGTVITIAIVVWIPSLRHDGIAELALKVVAVGLALAAVVELTYTLFTEGPDEALDPLILGLSSFILLKISDPVTDLTLSNAGTFAILIAALAVLFILRHQFIEKPKRDKADRSISAPEAADKAEAISEAGKDRAA